MRRLPYHALGSLLLLAAGPAVASSALHEADFAGATRKVQTNECRVVARWIDPYTGDVYEHVQCVIYSSGRI